MKKEDKANYQKAIKRDGGVCIECGNRVIELHHIVYKSLGGSNDERNIVCLCKSHHMHYHSLGKEGTQILLERQRGIYGMLEITDLKIKGKYSHFKYGN